MCFRISLVFVVFSEGLEGSTPSVSNLYSTKLDDHTGQVKPSYDFSSNRIEEVSGVAKELARWANSKLQPHYPGIVVSKARGFRYVTPVPEAQNRHHLCVFIVDNVTSLEEHKALEDWITTQEKGWVLNYARNHPFARQRGHAALVHQGASNAERLLLKRMSDIVQRLMPDATAYSMYTNRHDLRQPGLPHVDEGSELSQGATALYYTSIDSRLPSGGYTVFFDAALKQSSDALGVAVLDSLLDDAQQQQDSSALPSDLYDIALAVRPLPRRVLIFDSRLLHQALPPSVPFPKVRHTTAIKFRSKMAGQLLDDLKCNSSKVQQVVELLCSGEL